MQEDDQDVIIDDDDDEIIDEPVTGVLQQTFKCKKCGAKLEFKPGSDSQYCGYCDSEILIPKSEDDIHELDFKTHLKNLSDQSEFEEHQTVKCEYCAAETIINEEIVSTECSFCGMPMVTTATSKRHIKPKSLLPFKVTRKEGWASFEDWIKTLWFAPNDLKRKARQQDKLTGMYVPYWTYDSDTTSFYRGMRGVYYYVNQSYTTMVNGKSVRRTRRVRKTRWYPASGTVWNSFDDVLVLASKSLPRNYTEKLEPWDLHELTPYKDEYLSGFSAESYNIDLDEGFIYANEIMDETIRKLIKRDIGGDTQRITSVQTEHSNVTFKHILLPTWISAYRYGSNVYRFLINGRTGEVQGERPWSWIKITLAAVAAIALGAIIVYLANQT